MPLNRNKGLRYNIIDELLKKRRGYTIEEIRAKVNDALADWDNKEVTPRTIYNDLNELQSVYDLDITKAGHRYKYTDPNDSFRKSRANRDEQQTVELSLEAFAGTMRHFPFFNKFSDVINRLLAGDLYAGMEDEEKARIIQIGESYNESGQQYIEKIYEAIKNKTAIAVLYNKGPKSMNWRTISPYILKEYRNQWYMVGYSKDSSRGASSSVYAIGDIVKGPALAHVASAEGIICVEKIAGHHPEPLNYNNIPGCTYCLPEVASVGYTEKAAKDAGYQIKVGKFPFSASGKASAAGAKEGFVKVIFDAKYGEFLGAHMVGANVTEMIAEVVAARKLETTGMEIIKTVHPHPTMSEAVMEAAALAYGECIHL